MVIESIDEGGDGDLATVQERHDKFGEILINGENILSPPTFPYSTIYSF